MKNLTIIFITLISLTVLSCKDNAASKISDEKAAEAKDRVLNGAENLPVMTFVSDTFEFGTINEGDEVHAVFEFQNTGKTDLIITNAKASCGCTVPDWPKNKAIKPGEKSQIKALFRSKGKRNAQNKSITLTTNTANIKEVVHVKGFVTPKPKKDKKGAKSTNKGSRKGKKQNALTAVK